MTRANNAEPYDHHRGRRPLLRPTRLWRRALVLTINLAGFAAANAFWRYLATGRWADFSVQAYRRDLTMPLTELGAKFIYPLNLLNYPWLVLAMGLLLAGVIFVPVIIAVLYRLPVAAVFVLVVAVAGHAPVLALTLALACGLAARTPLRSDMPFLAFLLGMIPVGAYLYLLGLAGTDSPAVQPLQRWILVAPSAMAFVLAVLAVAVVLALARLMRYRPGAVSLATMVFLAGPLAIFYTKIGPDELDFALIAGGLGPHDSIFAPASLAKWRARHAQGLSEDKVLNSIRDDLNTRRRMLNRRCEEFLRVHPRSARAAAVLWIQGQCTSLQVSVPSLDAGGIRYVLSRPLAASAPAWRRLSEGYGDTPQAALAQWRLAELALQDGDVADADARLQRAAKALRDCLAGPEARPGGRRLSGVFRPPPPLPSREYLGDALFEVDQLIWMIERNRLLEDARSAEAMAAYMKVDRHALKAAEYYQKLADLAGEYEATRLGENLKLAVAGATANLHERADQLILLSQQRADIDAAIEANFELGCLAIREPVLQLKPSMENARVYFERVVEAPPNPWQESARQRLAWLRSATTRAG